MKKILKKFAIVLALVMVGFVSIYAQDSGTCGDNLTWALTGEVTDLTLTISGTGAMYSYKANKTPWSQKRDKIKPHQFRANIKTLILPEGLTSISDWAFCTLSGLTSVTIPNTVESIGNTAFAFCWGLTSITIPNSVTSIGKEAFAFCGGLTSITIPSSVTSLGKDAFYITVNLKDIYVYWLSPPDIKSVLVFIATKADVNLHIPQGALAEYQISPLWKRFNIVEDITGNE